jgi:hypothetical protein
MARSIIGPARVHDRPLTGLNLRRVFEPLATAFQDSLTSKLTDAQFAPVLNLLKTARTAGFVDKLKGVWFLNGPTEESSLKNSVNPLGTFSTLVPSNATHQPGLGWRLNTSEANVSLPDLFSKISQTTTNTAAYDFTRITVGMVEDASSTSTIGSYKPLICSLAGRNWYIGVQTRESSYYSDGVYMDENYIFGRMPYYDKPRHYTFQLGNNYAARYYNGILADTTTYNRQASSRLALGSKSGNTAAQPQSRFSFFYIAENMTEAEIAIWHAAIDAYLLATRPGWLTFAGNAAFQFADNFNRVVNDGFLWTDGSSTRINNVLRGRRKYQYVEPEYDNEGNYVGGGYTDQQGPFKAGLNYGFWNTRIPRNYFFEARFLWRACAIRMAPQINSPESYGLDVGFYNGQVSVVAGDYRGNTTLVDSFTPAIPIMGKLIRAWIAGNALYVKNITDNVMLVNGVTNLDPRSPNGNESYSNFVGRLTPFAIFNPDYQNSNYVDEYVDFMDDVRLGLGTGE